MDIYKILHILVLCCMINEGLTWFGRRSSSSSRRSSSSRSVSRNSGSSSSSSRRGSGWFGRNSRQSNTPKPKPKPKPKPSDSGKTRTGWWWRRTTAKPKLQAPTPKPTQKPKPIDSGKTYYDRWNPYRPKPVVNKPTEKKTKETVDKKVIEGYEGLRTRSYDAQPKNSKVHDTTIGIGFNLNREDAKETFNKVAPGVDFDKVKSGKQTITKDQARALFNHDIDTIYEPRAQRVIGKDLYDTLPGNVKTALVNAVYRGDLTPETSKLMKQGKWEEAGKKYLEHYQYKDADKLGIPGVKTRMDWNKEQFDTMINE